MGVDAGTATGYLDLDISGFLNGLRSAQSEAQRTTNNMVTQIGDGFQGVGKALTSAGSTLTKGITVPIVGLGTTIVKISADFESAMDKVRAISGAAGEDFDKLTAKAREMGAKTKFSASEAADAFQYMAMAGWDVENMLGGIEGVMNLAAASGEDLATVSDIVTDAMTAFGLAADGTSKVLKDGLEIEVDNTTRFVDALAAASNSSNTNVAMLGESFKYVAPVAGALGYSVEDTAIALGLMANQGIKASQAGTALRTVLTNMANPTDTIQSAMDALGVSLENDDGSMKSLMEVMQDLRNGFGQGRLDADEFSKSMMELSDEFTQGKIKEKIYEQGVKELMVAMYGAEGAQKAQLAAQLAGKTGMAGLLAIVNTGEEDFNNLADSIYNAAGTSQEMADIMNDNLNGQITIMISALQELALQFGEILLPKIKDVVAWLQDLIAKLQQMSPEQREQIVKWVAIAAAIGPVLLIFGKLITSIGSIITAFGKIPGVLSKVKLGFTSLKTAAINVKEGFQLVKAGFPALGAEASKLGAVLAGISAPMVAIVAVIGVLVAAFKHLWDTNEEFRNNIKAIWDEIKAKFEEFGQGIVDRLNELGFDFKNITEVISAIWDGFCNLLAPVFEAAFQIISDILGGVLDIIIGILDVFIGLFTGNWEQLWNGIKEIFGGVWDIIVGIFEGAIDAIKGIADTILQWFGTTWEKAWTDVKDFFVNMWDNVTSFFDNTIESIKTGVSNFISSIIDFFSQLPDNILDIVTDAYKNVVQWVENMIERASYMGRNFLKVIVEFFTDLPYKVGYFIGNTLANVVIWATDMINKAKEMARDFLNNIVVFFTQLPGKIKEFITSAYNNIVRWATDMVDKAKEMAKDFLDNIIDYFTKLPGKIKDFLTSAYNNVKSWASDMVDKAKEAAKDFLDNAVDTIRDLPSKIKEFLDESIENLKDWASDMGEKGKEAIKELLDSIAKAAKDIPKKVKSIGTDIVEGIWKGIKDAKDDFIKNIQDFFSGIVDGVKDALGIKSPSRVFANEIGRWLPPGIAVGFNSAMPSAMKQVQDSLDDGIDSLEADDIDIGIKNDIIKDDMIEVASSIADYYESIENRLAYAVENMRSSLEYLIAAGTAAANGIPIGYVGYNGIIKSNSNDSNKSDDNASKDESGSRTYIFYTTKAIDEIEAARQMQRAERDMAEGFV